MVFLYVLVLNATLVGMALGVLLPMVFCGFCSGGAAALMVGTVIVIHHEFYFPMAGAATAILGAILSSGYVVAINEKQTFPTTCYVQLLS